MGGEGEGRGRGRGREEEVRGKERRIERRKEKGEVR